MTVVTESADYAPDFLHLDLKALLKGAYSAYDINDTAVAALPSYKGALTETGDGLGVVDSHGFATGGTITDIYISRLGESQLSLFSAFVSAADVEHALLSGKIGALNKVLFSGNDTLISGPAGGTFVGLGGNDEFFGDAGTENFYGGNGADVLSSAGGRDHLFGGKGNDVLHGDEAADSLTGGPGRDVFNYANIVDSQGSAIDTIADLENRDVIDLSPIDADTSTPSDDDAFSIVAHFTHAAGQLTIKFDSAHHRTVIKGDVDGDGNADITIFAAGDHHTYSNFGF